MRNSALAPRANWKGFLKIADVICPVALYTAASTSDRIAFHTINRATGNRVHRQFVDSDTGKPVERDDQVKGYETGSGEYVVLEPEDVAGAVPQSDKTLAVDAFIRCGDIDDVYFDKPYYLTPSDRHDEAVFELIRDGMRTQKVAALAQTVLFRRVRTLLIYAHRRRPDRHDAALRLRGPAGAGCFRRRARSQGQGRDAGTGRTHHPDKARDFDPARFDDRYEAALADLVKAKMEGKKIEARQEKKPEKVVDLMAALRESAGMAGKKPTAKPRSTATRAKRAAPRRKAS